MFGHKKEPDAESGQIPTNKLHGRDGRPKFKRTNSLLFDDTISSATEHDYDNVSDSLFDYKSLNPDAKKIDESLNFHNIFPAKAGYKLGGLPKFDSITQYGVTPDQERDLWRLEVDRLMETANSGHPPRLEGNDQWFGTVPSAGGYNRLHRLALQARYAFDVYAHDNELITMEHFPVMKNRSTYDNAHTRIARVFNAEEGCMRYERDDIRLQKNNDEAYHALINYITAFLVHILVRTLEGNNWVENCISVVSRCAAKMKVLNSDLHQAFQCTLDEGRDVKVRISKRSEHAYHFLPDQDPNVEPQEDGRVSVTPGTYSSYFVEMASYRNALVGMMSAVLDGIAYSEELDQKADIFESCAIIYDTGLRKNRAQRALLCEERDGSIGVTGDQRIVHLANVVFNELYRTWYRLDDRKSKADYLTTLTWCQSSSGGHFQPRQRFLTSMVDVVQALIPYSTFCGSFTSHLSVLCRHAIMLADPFEPLKFYRQDKLLTVAKIHTNAHQTRKRQRERLKHHDSNHIYDTDLARQTLKGLPVMAMATAAESFNEWTIDEKSIIIKQRRYSLISLTVCAVLILGGITFISIEDAASGVDPSNLTALVWAAAGFAMVFFKSQKVQEWPWRDFFRGRVVCSSISEVVSVTKMDPQMLLAILLRIERRILIKTRGPFNHLFQKKTEDGVSGFSIDVALETNTVLSGGYIVVRVENVAGPALVAIRTSERIPYHTVKVKDSATGINAFLDLADPPIDVLKDDVGKEKRVPLFTAWTSKLDWHATRGVFTAEARFS